MISRYDAFLNGQALSAIHPDILVLDIRHTPASFKTESYTTAKRHGSRVYRRQADKASVQITFEIHSYSTVTRQAICQAVAQWARKGGILTTTDRPGQILDCICETPPSIASALRWTDPLTIVLTAYTLPFWQEANQSVLTLAQGTSGNGQLYVPGVVQDALVEVDATAKAKITSLSLTVGGRTIALSGLNVASGTVIKIAYDAEQIQSIKAGNTSLLDKRTGVDDLTLDCGESTLCSFTSDAAVQVTFKTRGLWL